MPRTAAALDRRVAPSLWHGPFNLPLPPALPVVVDAVGAVAALLVLVEHRAAASPANHNSGSFRGIVMKAGINAACLAILISVNLSQREVTAAPAPAPAQTLAFEVASIKPNADGFIDIGGGLRLLSGQTRCQAVDTRPVPGDPLPAAGLGRCNVRNSTLKEIINVAYGLRLGAPRSILNQMIVAGPSWAETAVFDIEAKAENPSTTTTQQMMTM